MKYAFTLIYSVFILSAYSQDKLSGIGRIRLGRTLSELKSELPIEDIVDANDRNVGFLDIMENKKNYLLIYDSLREAKKYDFLHMYERCPKAKIILLSKYTIAGMDVKKIKLTFYNDSLVSVYVNDPSIEFIDALAAKYGEGKLETKSTQVTCKSLYGEVNYSDETFYTYWNKGTNFEAVHCVSQYRDSKCQKKFLSFFYIRDASTFSKMEDCSTVYSKKDEDAKKAADKKKLADF